MRILRFDSVGGASGDMILAALAGLGVNMRALREQLASLPLEQFEIREQPFSDHGFSGTQVTVNTPGTGKKVPERNLEDIRNIIEGSKLPDRVKAMSLSVFRRLAEAEATVHGVSSDKVHFHEAGAVDSIVDITASCAALDMLNIDEVVVGPLPLGCGTAECRHGAIPLPSPATVELLKGHPVIQIDEPFEMVTPTAAAMLMEWHSGKREAGIRLRQGYGGQGGKREEMVIVKTANGFGHRKLSGRANLLRAMVLEATDNGQRTTDVCLVMECNIDDTVPELLGSLAQKLMEKGALDVFTTSIQMKKQRPGTLLTVLCRPEDKAGMLDLIFRESTTFGVREYMTTRTVLERRHIEVETPYGKVRVKIGQWQGKDITRAPEHDDCARRAREHGVSVREVYEAAMRASQ